MPRPCGCPYSAQAQLPPSDHLLGGMGLRSRELPAAQEWSGALPGPPSAECLSGRELHCAERCVHQVVGDLSDSRQETQPQCFVWGWALLPTLFKPLWCSKSEGPAERRLGLFFIQQRDQIVCIPGVFPECLAGLPLLMFQVSAQMSSTQRQRPWPPSTRRQPPRSPPVCSLLVSSWYPPLSVVPTSLRGYRRPAFLLDCPSSLLCGVFSWHTLERGDKCKFLIDIANFPSYSNGHLSQQRT